MTIQVDVQKARREGMRWYLLLALDNARPLGALDVLLLQILQDVYERVTPTELHQQLDYLLDKGLVEVDKKADGHWHSKLTANGVDVAEYAVDCDVGIARPPKYWE